MGKERLQKLNWIFMAASFIGFLDALYLSVERMRGVKVICIILDGCDKVTTSLYSTMLNVPVAYLGALYYLTIFILALGFLAFKKDQIIRLMSWMTGIGFLASTWFVYLQVFIIKSICLYCMISATTSATLFIAGSYYLVNRSRKIVHSEADNHAPLNGIM